MSVIRRSVLAAMTVAATCRCVQAATDITTPGGGVITYSSSLSPYLGTKAFDDGFPLTSGSRWLAYVSQFPNVLK